MKRPRVLQVVSGVAIGDQSGGAEQFALRLASLLPAEGFESAVFSMWKYSSEAEARWLSLLADKGVSVHGLVESCENLPGGLAGVFRSLWHTTSVVRPHVIGSHSERGDIMNALVHLLHPTHPRSVRTMHTDEQWQTHPMLGPLIARFAFPPLFDREVAISDAARVKMDGRPLAKILRKRATLCYNGIAAAGFSGPAPANGLAALPAGIPDVRPVIGVVGRLATQKGHHHLLPAMASVCRYRPARLLIVGSGALEDELRRQAAELGIGNVVWFLGSRQDVPEILKGLDLLVSASLWEGFPTVILEAMAAGVPVLATDVSGSRELVRHEETGHLVRPGSSGELARAMLHVLADPAHAATLAETARTRAAQFTIENAARQYAAMYRGLLGL